jgi:hypothetical protein
VIRQHIATPIVKIPKDFFQAEDLDVKLFIAHLKRLEDQGREVSWQDAPVVIGRLINRNVPSMMKAMEQLLDDGLIAVYESKNGEHGNKLVVVTI